MCRFTSYYFSLLVCFYTKISNSSNKIAFQGRYTPREHPSSRYNPFGNHFIKGMYIKTQSKIVLRQSILHDWGVPY